MSRALWEPFLAIQGALPDVNLIFHRDYGIIFRGLVNGIWIIELKSSYQLNHAATTSTQDVGLNNNSKFICLKMKQCRKKIVIFETFKRICDICDHSFGSKNHGNHGNLTDIENWNLLQTPLYS